MIDAHCAEALFVARTTDDPWTLWRALDANAIVGDGSPDLPWRLEIAQELATSTRFRPDPRFRALAQLARGDVAGFDADAAAFEADPDPWRLAVAASWRGARALLDGRFDQVGGHIDQALTAFEANSNFQTLYLVQTFWLNSERGTLADIAPLVDGALSDLGHFQAVRAAGALTALEIGHEARARQLLIEAATALDEVPRDFTWTFLLSMNAEVAWRLDEPGVLTEVARHLEPWSGQLLVTGTGTHVPGAADRFLGLAAARACKHDEADRYFAAALALEARAGARPLATRTRLAWAEALARRGDDDTARPMMEAALDEARRLGMLGVERQCLALSEAIDE